MGFYGTPKRGTLISWRELVHCVWCFQSLFTVVLDLGDPTGLLRVAGRGREICIVLHCFDGILGRLRRRKLRAAGRLHRGKTAFTAKHTYIAFERASASLSFMGLYAGPSIHVPIEDGSLVGVKLLGKAVGRHEKFFCRFLFWGTETKF